MNAFSHEFDLSQATMLPPLGDMPRPALAGDLAARWDAVHEAAYAVGRLAQLSREDWDETIAGLPQRAMQAGGAECELVARSVDDLAAVMEPGLRALLSLTAKGRDTTAAALTLWREFHCARTAILSLVEPHEG